MITLFYLSEAEKKDGLCLYVSQQTLLVVGWGMAWSYSYLICSLSVVYLHS